MGWTLGLPILSKGTKCSTAAARFQHTWQRNINLSFSVPPRKQISYKWNEVTLSALFNCILTYWFNEKDVSNNTSFLKKISTNHSHLTNDEIPVHHEAMVEKLYQYGHANLLFSKVLILLRLTKLRTWSTLSNPKLILRFCKNGASQACTNS